MERGEGSGEMIPEIPDFLYGANDDPILTDLPGDTEEASDVSCPITKFFKTAELAASTNLGRSAHQHIHNFAVESAPLDAAVANHYRKIAEAAAKKEPGAGAGDRLAKGEVASRMASLLTKLRPDCTAAEERQLEAAAAALDVACFVEITENIIARLKRAA
jgi:hypothetical protein